jgi:hypothetical protein
MKTLTTMFALVSIYIASYAINPTFKKMKVEVMNSHGIEFLPDLYVTYTCSNYKRMQGLEMRSNNSKTEVTVNYGGWGRRRGFRQFKCNDN